MEKRDHERRVTLNGLATEWDGNMAVDMAHIHASLSWQVSNPP